MILGHWVHIGTAVSLGFIVVTLLVAVAASAVADRRAVVAAADLAAQPADAGRPGTEG
jgi:hypothetical protein